MKTGTIVACPKCRVNEIAVNGDAHEWTVVCWNCFDADDTGTSSIVAHGKTRDEAVANWNQLCEEADECDDCREDFGFRCDLCKADFCGACAAKHDCTKATP